MNDKEKNANSSKSYSAPALEKGLDILEALCDSERGLTQKELSAKLGRSISELYRMLYCLVHRSYVAQYNDKFAITTKLFQLSQIHPPTQRLLAEAVPIMEALSSKVGFSCDLRIYNKGSQTVIASVVAPSGIGFTARVGAEIMVAPSASGRVLLAFQNSETLEFRIFESFKEYSPRDIAAFRKELHEVAIKGYTSMPSPQFQGVYSVAYPILDHNRHAIAAITVPMVARIDGAPQTTRNEVEGVMREMADKLSRRIS